MKYIAVGVNLIAGVWGFAEATLFFIVPDLWLSIAGRHQLHAGLRACLYSLGGALIGGSIIYLWGVYDHASAVAIMEKIPAVNAEMGMTVILLGWTLFYLIFFLIMPN